MIFQWMGFLLMAAVLLLGGCTFPEAPEFADTMAIPDFVGVPVETPDEPPIAPPAKARQTAWDVQKEKSLASNSNYISRDLFSLALVDVELKEALAILSKESPVPIVAESGVSGRVTINIKDKSLGDLLFTMLRPLGYKARIEEGMIVVGASQLITRSFVINYLKDTRTSSSVTNAAVSAGSSSSNSSSGGATGNVSVTTAGGSDYWTEIIKGVESIAYGKDPTRAKDSKINIVTNQLAGVIHVTAPAKTMEVISSFLDDLEREVKRQVLIQAHIVEIELKDEFSLGIDWNIFFDNLKGSISLDTASALVPGASSFVIDIDTSDFDLIIDTFAQQGAINMLSSPKISTLNNQKAVIKLTTKEVTWVQSVLRDTDGNITETINTPEIDEVGLFLDVTPNIADTGSITMQVHPSITEVKEISVSPDGNSSKPVITVREIDAMVDVRSGQTMVIGGLIGDKISTGKSGVPVLGDIPYLGWLFASHKQEKRKNELVIFLTPYVLNDDIIESIRTEHEKRIWENEGINNFIDKLMQ